MYFYVKHLICKCNSILFGWYINSFHIQCTVWCIIFLLENFTRWLLFDAQHQIETIRMKVFLSLILFCTLFGISTKEMNTLFIWFVRMLYKNPSNFIDYKKMFHFQNFMHFSFAFTFVQLFRFLLFRVRVIASVA